MLTSKEEGLDRERYLEIYKLRNTAHLKGRHNLLIEKGGITIFPRYIPDGSVDETPPSVEVAVRLPSGTLGLDELIGGGLLRRSITLVSGSAGIGKSTLGIQFLIAGAKQRERGIYVTMEEGETQILNTADALGLPLREAVKRGFVEIVHLSRERVRGAQFPAILTSKIGETKARRLVLDGATHIVAGLDGNDELRKLLYKLAVRFKALDVTSIFTVESKALFSTGSVTDRDFSPIADNLLMLRYVTVEGAVSPSLTVVKTRGSAHDRDIHLFEIGKGGMGIGQAFGKAATGSEQGGAADKNQRAKKTRRK